MYETRSLVCRVSYPSLNGRSSITGTIGNDHDSGRHTGRSGAAGHHQRIRLIKKIIHVRGFRTEILFKSGSYRLWQLADFAILPECGRSAEGTRVWRQSTCQFASQPGHPSFASQYRPADEEQQQAHGLRGTRWRGLQLAGQADEAR